VKRKPAPKFYVLEGQCAGPEVCPLSRVRAGTTVCIKRLSTAPEMTDRLRELGFCEEQSIKLLARESNYICQVCNARLGISRELAESILVQAPPDATAPA
jgi:Fe2+ transport system protein FeoA